MRKALVVLSGGQDSTTALFWAKEHFEEVHAITFNYGQLHIIEVNAAMKVAKMAGVASHEIIHVPHCLVSTSPLITHTDLERYADHREMERIIGGRVEKTFVPMRNAFFFVIAMNHAVALGSYDLVTGVCQEDNANYPDCTETFVNRFISMTNASMGAATNEFYIPCAANAPNESGNCSHVRRYARMLEGACIHTYKLRWHISAE